MDPVSNQERTGRITLLDIDQIFCFEAEGDDGFIRGARKTLHRPVEPLEEIEPHLSSPPFFRIYRSYIVILDRMLELRLRGERDHSQCPPSPLPLSCPPTSHLKTRRYIVTNRQEGAMTDSSCELISQDLNRDVRAEGGGRLAAPQDLNKRVTLPAEGL